MTASEPTPSSLLQRGQDATSARRKPQSFVPAPLEQRPERTGRRARGWLQPSVEPAKTGRICCPSASLAYQSEKGSSATATVFHVV